MSTPIRRKRATDNISGMAPPTDPISAFKRADKEKIESFKSGVKDKIQGHKDALAEKSTAHKTGMPLGYMTSVNKSVDETQRNVRQVKALYDALVKRILLLEGVNEALPDIPYVPKLIEGEGISIDKLGRDLRITNIAAIQSALNIAPSFKYDATVAAAADPTAGLFRLNHATIASSTEMYINDAAINTLDISGVLGDASADSHIYLQNTERATEALSLKVVSATDNTGWWTIVYTVDAIATETTWTELATFAFLFPLSAGGGGADPYYFGVSIKDDDEVTVAAGKVINGTTVSSISQSDHTIGTTNGTYYLSIEIWYNAAWKSAYLSGTSYPTQGTKSDTGTFPCTRVLIAVVVVADNAISSVTQVWPGHEIVNPRVAD